MRSLIATLLLFAGIQLSACTSSDHDGKQSALRIGVIASLTGPAAQPGESWMKGAQFAADELKGRGTPVELIVEDDKSQTAAAVSAFQKLVRVDKAQVVIGGTWDFLAEVVYPLAHQLSVPFLTPTNPIEILSAEAKENPFVFTNALTLAAERAVVKGFLDRERPRTIALIYADIPWGNLHAAMMRELAAEFGAVISYENRFPMESYPDVIKLSALKLREVNPDLVFVTFDDSGLDLFATELHRLQIPVRVLDPQHLKNALRITKDNSKFERFFTLLPKLTDLQFEERFGQKFGPSSDVFAAVGYDAVRFVAEAFQQTGALRRETAVRYDGITGTHLLPTDDGGVVRNEAEIYAVRGGRLVRH